MSSAVSRGQRWGRRRRCRRILAVVAAGLATAFALTACGPIAAQQRAVKLYCRGANTSIVLVAQAVPTATLLPCIDALPAGWSFESLEAQTGTARIWFNADRAGNHALEVILTGTCATAGIEIPTDEPGTRLWLDIHALRPRFVGIRTYTFPGGCLLYRFDFPSGTRSILNTDATTIIALVSRVELERELAEIGFNL